MKNVFAGCISALVGGVLVANTQGAIIQVGNFGLGETGTVTTTASNFAPLLDSSGGAHNIKTGQIINNAVASIITTGLTAPGSTAALRLSNSAGSGSGYYDNLNPYNYTDNFALDIYVRPDTSAGTILLQTDGTTAGLSLWAQYSGSGQKLVMAHGGSGGTASPTTGITYATGTWYKIDLIRDNGTNYFYVNNTLYGSDTLDASLVQPRLGFATGAGNSTAAAFDSMKIYSFAATDSVASVLAATAVPEPSSLALLAVTSIGLFKRRRLSLS